MNEWTFEIEAGGESWGKEIELGILGTGISMYMGSSSSAGGNEITPVSPRLFCISTPKAKVFQSYHIAKVSNGLDQLLNVYFQNDPSFEKPPVKMTDSAVETIDTRKNKMTWSVAEAGLQISVDLNQTTACLTNAQNKSSSLDNRCFYKSRLTLLEAGFDLWRQIID